MAAPTITKINPTSGTTAGGNPVVITGANFTNPAVTGVTFAGLPAAFVINSDTEITTSPPAGAGPYVLVVTNADGFANAVYTYTTGLTLAPTSATSAGGTTVSIFGTNLQNTSAVHFGTKSATFTQISATQVNATSPAGNGAVGVTITTPGDTSSPANFFYLGPPQITSVSPVSGQFIGGNTVTITGTNLATVSTANFGANTAAITAVSDSQITVTAPRANSVGTVAVLVVTAGGSTNGVSYTYVANPVLTALSPSSGPTSGGNTVTLTGTDLTLVGQVVFGPDAIHSGGEDAAFTVDSDTTIEAVVPPEVAGTADVIVKTPGGFSSLTAGYTYVVAPGI